VAIETLKGGVSKAWGQVTLEQRVWVARTLLFMGCGWLWRAAQHTWPSIGLSLIGLAIFAAAVVCFLRLLTCTPRSQALIAWIVPFFVGGFLNFSVLLANGGFMPSACQDVADGLYIPITGASLVYLSDWLWGFVSPGDILIVIGLLGIMGTLVWKQRQHKLMEQACTKEEI